MSSTPPSALSVPGICIDNGESEGVPGFTQPVTPDCYLEDLERPGILPPAPLRAVSPATQPSSDVVKRSFSLRDLQRESRRDIRPLSGPLVSQCVMPRPALIPLAMNKLPSIPQDEKTSAGGRLPGTFDSLSLVQDTGLTPSPRADTPLVLLPGGGEGSSLASAMQSRFLSTSYLQHRSGALSGSNEDRHRPSADPEAACDEPPEDDEKSVESYNTAASSLSLGHVCKICHCGEEEGEPQLITPCLCSGSLKFVHQECLHRWIKSSDIKKCELCKFTFLMHSKVKPLTEWEKLDMSGMERRKLCCSITFHMIAITCVIWSLYVLIDRTTEEIQSGELQWPFWTKLVVVAIGFTGGLVFMYIQCKVYLHICRKWRAYNRTIVVQDLPLDVIKTERIKILKARKPGKEFQVYFSDPELGPIETPVSASCEGSQGSEASSIGSRSSGQSSTASPTSEPGSGRSTHAETQTRIRGITLETALRQNQTRHDSQSSNSSALSVATISRLLEQMDSGAVVGGASLVTVPAVIFFTESDMDNNPARARSRMRGPLSDPVLICDLPGQQHCQDQEEEQHNQTNQHRTPDV